MLRRDGQPWIFVDLAVQLAASADRLRELIEEAIGGDRSSRPLPSRPPINQWLPMYRKHRAMQDGVAATEGLPGDLTAHGLPDDLTGSDGLDLLRECSRVSRDDAAAVSKALTEEQRCQFLLLFCGVPFPPDDATLRRMLGQLEADAAPGEADRDSILDEVLASPAGQFYVRVWLPCWVLYRDYPPRLLRAARLGDLDALDRLLRLDKSVVGEPRIAEQVAITLSTGSVGEQNQILASLKGKPKTKLTDKAIRAGLGALISQFALLFHTEVTAPETQRLFDAIERIRSGRLNDAAIPDAPESWARAIQRNRTWPGLPTQRPGQ